MKDDEGLMDFCRAEYPRLVGLLGLYTGDRAVGEELAQETLARVWRSWPKVHHLERPDAWAQRVGINLANSHLRRVLAERRARRRMPPVEEVIDRRWDDVMAVRSAVSSLPRRQREAVVLHYYLDLELVEVAERMGSTVPGVKSLLHRAVRKLRAEDPTGRLLEVHDVT